MDSDPLKNSVSVFHFKEPMPKAKTAPAPEPEPEPQEERKSRLSFALNEDGSIDLSSTRSATIAKLKTAIASNPDLRGETNSTPESEKFPRDFVPPIWDSIAAMTRMVGRIALAWPADLARRIEFTKEEKEKLTEPTAQMIDKYGAGLKKWAVEINFANAVAQAVGGMAQRAVSDYVQELEPDPRQQPVNGRDASPADTASDATASGVRNL